MSIRKKLICIFICLCVVIINCDANGGNDSDINISVFNVFAMDYGNSAHSGDIRVSFTVPQSNSIIESYRVLVVKSDSADSFNLQKADVLAIGQYFEVDKNSNGVDIVLSESLNDSDDELIKENVPYVLFVLSVGFNTENQLSKPSNEVTLKQENLVKTLAENIDGGSGGVALDTDGNIYMGDFGQTLGGGGGGDKVFRITQEGEVSIFARGFIGASGNSFDSQGNLFQSSIRGSYISKIAPDGSVSQFSSGAPIVNPVGILIDEDDELFVADCEGFQVLKIDKNGDAEVFTNNSLLNCPNGITGDENGNIYISNFYDGNVLKITPNKQVSVLVNLPGNNNGHLTFHNGFLYVIARTANQIYKVSLDGEAELFAGSGMRGKKDGAALGATFSLPNDLIFNEDGSKLYVNDVVPLSGGNIAPCNIRVVEIVE